MKISPSAGRIRNSEAPIQTASNERLLQGESNEGTLIRAPRESINGYIGPTASVRWLDAPIRTVYHYDMLQRNETYGRRSSCGK